MTKTLLLSACLLISLASFSQHKKYIAPKNKFERTKKTSAKNILSNWNVQLDFNVPYGNGVETDGTYFYVTSTDDSLIQKYDLLGNLLQSFSIAGVNSLFELTYDGTYFYGVAGSDKIYKMDFNSHTLVNTITCTPASLLISAICYDAVNGGFWVADLNSDIFLVNANGIPLDTVLYSNHQLDKITGIALDNATAGGPYLWVFNQGYMRCDFVMINIASEQQTGVYHDVIPDLLASIDNSYSGGMFLFQNLINGSVTIGGIINNNQIFGYDLSTLVAQKDLGVYSFNSPNVSGSCLLSSNENIQVTIWNYGLQPISGFDIHLTINDTTHILEHVNSAIPSFDYLDYTFSSPVDFSNKGRYQMSAYTSFADDGNTANDTLNYRILTGNSKITVNIETDDWGQETWFGIYDIFNSEMTYSTQDVLLSPLSYYSTDICIDSSKCYDVIIFDDYGDGIFSPQGYEVLYNNQLVDSNYNFSGYSDTVNHVGVCNYYDLAITSLLSPKSQCGLGSNELVSIRIKNTGTRAVNSYEAFYTINGIDVSEPVSDSIYPGQSKDYYFVNSVDLHNVGIYPVQVKIVCSGDAVRANDTNTYVVEKYNPDIIPSSYNFDSLVNSIVIEDENNDGNTWQFSASEGVDNSACMVYNYSANSSALDWFFSRCLNLTAATNYQLKFMYKASSYEYPEKLKVYIGTYPFSAAMFSDTLFDLNNIIDSLYQEATVNFTVQNDGVYYLGWNAYSDANQWKLFVDNIQISSLVNVNQNPLKPEIRIFPNPVSNYLNAEITSEVDTKAKIIITDIMGQIIYSNEYNLNMGANSIKINTANLERGIYLLKFINGDIIKVQKFTK